MVKMSFSKLRFFSLIFVSFAFISCGNLFENQLSSEDTKNLAAEASLKTPAATTENQNKNPIVAKVFRSYLYFNYNINILDFQ